MKKKSKSYHHGNLKEELIIEATRFIIEQGEDALTLKELSKKLHITPPALYRHFSSKEDLIKNVMNHAFDLFDEIIIAVETNKKYSCIEKFYFFGKEYLNFATSKPNLFNVMFGTRFSSLRDVNNREEAKSLYTIADRLLEGQKNGVIKEDNPLNQVSVIHSTLHGLAKLYINEYDYVKQNLDSLYDTSFEIVMSGLMINPINLKDDIEIIKKKIKEKNYD